MSLLDGTLVAVDPGSGRLLWTFDSGSPLVSASGAAEEGSHVGTGSAVQPCCPTAIFPGVDGALYAYKQDGELGRGLEVKSTDLMTHPSFHQAGMHVASPKTPRWSSCEARHAALEVTAALSSSEHTAEGRLCCLRCGQRLPLSVQEVVEEAPSLTEDGALVVGSRTTTVFLVDPGTGRLERAFLEYGGGLAEINNAVGAHSHLASS